jgi:hypothetical protein
VGLLCSILASPIAVYMALKSLRVMSVIQVVCEGPELTCRHRRRGAPANHRTGIFVQLRQINNHVRSRVNVHSPFSVKAMLVSPSIEISANW